MLSRTGWLGCLLVACLVLVTVAGSAPAPGDGVTSTALVGGRSWYVCGAFAVGKWFFITNPPLFAAVTIAGGLACGFGL